MTSYVAAHKRPANTLRRARMLARAYIVSLSLGAVVAAAVSGVSIAKGDKALAVLPLAAVIGICLAALACTRYRDFVLLLLGVRSSIDVLHLSGSTAGTTTGNTVSARGIDPSSLVGVLFLAVSILWLAGRLYEGRRVHPSALTIWIVAFFLAGALSVIGSQHPQASALQCLRIMTVAMMFVVLEQIIVDHYTLKLTIAACYASLIIPLGYTFFTLATGSGAAEVKSGFSRLVGTFAQSNDYARYLGFMVVFGVAIMPYVKRRARITLGALLIVSSIVLVLTLTLGAIIGTVIGVVLVAALQRRTRLLLSLVVAGVIAVSFVPSLSARVSNSSASSQVGGAPTGNSLAWRLSYWAEVLPLADSNPFTGIGLNSTQYETDQAKQPHNDFLRAYVESGLVGLTAYLGTLLALFGTCLAAVRVSVRRTFDHAVATGALACTVAFILESLAANIITNVANLWYLIAFAAAAGYVRRASRITTEASLSGADRPPSVPVDA